MRSFHGVCRELYAGPDEPDAFPLIVVSPDAISLHVLRVESRARGKAPRLAVIRRDVVVEPLRQRHWTSGGWTITRWSDPGEGAERRYAWTPTPPHPQDEGNVIERLVRFYEPRIRRQVRGWLDVGAEVHQLLVFVGSTECCGDHVECSS